MLIEELQTEPQTLASVGHIQNVLKGRTAFTKWLHPKEFTAAFEIGSPIGLPSLGEMISFGGVAYCKSTDHAASHYGKVITGTKCVTTGAFVIPKDAQPTHRGTSDKLLKIDDFYRVLKRPFAFIGLATFSKLHATAIGFPPINEEDLLENWDKYYPHPPITLTDVPALLVGVAAPAPIEPPLDVVLYQNPLEKGDMVCHTHLLLLSHRPKDLAHVNPEHALDVLHLLSDSEMSECQFDIYAFDQLLPL